MLHRSQDNVRNSKNILNWNMKYGLTDTGEVLYEADESRCFTEGYEGLAILV